MINENNSILNYELDKKFIEEQYKEIANQIVEVFNEEINKKEEHVKIINKIIEAIKGKTNISD